MNDTELYLTLTKDLKAAVTTLTPREARYLVDTYYQMQNNRLRADGQVRSMTDEPHAVLDWLSENALRLEHQIRLALQRYAKASPLGVWALGICGIGPVISAGLLAHIDITKAPTVGHIWRYAGLDPTCQWLKGEKRPWNASLKTLCWKAGESFVKVSGKKSDIYGHIYQERKAAEHLANEAGKFSGQAAAMVTAQPKHAQIKTYREGRLPDGHLHSRAKRYAVKLFLSHYHHVAYVQHYGVLPPKPYPIAILGHAHEIPAPNFGEEQTTNMESTSVEE